VIGLLASIDTDILTYAKMARLLDLSDETLRRIFWFSEGSKRASEYGNTMEDYTFSPADRYEAFLGARSRAQVTLFHLMLVCCRFAKLVEPLLYDHICAFLRHAKFHRLLYRFYNSFRSVPAMSRTRIITFFPGSMLSKYRRQDRTSEEQEAFDFRRLFHLPNLEVLTIRGYDHSNRYQSRVDFTREQYKDGVWRDGKRASEMATPNFGIHASSVTTLRLQLTSPKVGGKALRRLLEYPRVLKELAYEIDYEDLGTGFSESEEDDDDGDDDDDESNDDDDDDDDPKAPSAAASSSSSSTPTEWDTSILIRALQSQRASLEALSLTVSEPETHPVNPRPRTYLTPLHALAHLRIDLSLLRGASADSDEYKSLPASLQTLHILAHAFARPDFCAEWLRRIARNKMTCFRG